MAIMTRRIAGPERDACTASGCLSRCPSYLLALAVGDLAFVLLGRNCGVWAEKPMIEASAYELADTQKMIDRPSDYGPYRWGVRRARAAAELSVRRQEIRGSLRDTHILAGDRSLVNLVAPSWRIMVRQP